MLKSELILCCRKVAAMKNEAKSVGDSISSLSCLSGTGEENEAAFGKWKVMCMLCLGCYQKPLQPLKIGICQESTVGLVPERQYSPD